MMIDQGHKKTDTLLDEMTRRIAKEYKQAEKEIQEKLDDYLRRFETKDKTWQRWVAEKKKTEAEYKKWRTCQIAMGKRWEEMKDTLAEDYHNANNIAKSIINGYMPEVYALNHNYGTFEVEKGALVDTSYTLYDRQTVERMMRDNPDMLPPPGKKVSKRIAEGKDIRWNKQHIQSVMTQSILQGESIPTIAKRLARKVGDSNYKAAIRNARTMTTGAECAGRVDSYKRAQDMGIEMEQMWVATLDSRTRHSHRLLDGETQKVGEEFSNGCAYPGDPAGPPEEVYNCFVGETKIASDSEIVRSYKHKYAGDLIVIKSAGGVEFTCTPNHPILTPDGWVRANALHKGDNLLVTLVGKHDSSGINPNINHVFPTMKAFHKFMKVFSAERACGLSVDFHGDRATANVEVVSKEWLLRGDGDSNVGNTGDKISLKNTDPFLLRHRHFVACLRRIYISAFSFMSGFRKALAFFWGRLRHTEVHSFGAVTGPDIRIPEYTIDNLPTATMIRRELLDGLSGHVFIDNIVSADAITGSAHVYNLQTKNGYYFVNQSIAQSSGKYNGIMAIAKNCRCTLIAQVKGFATDVEDLDLRNDNKLGDMSYEEWINAKEESNPITLPEEKAENIRQAYIAEYRRK